MRLNTIKPAEGSKKAPKRRGRGWSSGLGKTSCRGVKGQKARGKGKVAAGFEGGQMPLQRRIPKLGFTSWKRKVTAEVRLHELASFPANSEVDLAALKKAGVISGRSQFAKVIARGELSHAVNLKGIKATKGAIAAIEAAGGKVEA